MLQPGGVFLLVTLGDPSKRLHLLCKPEYKWQVSLLLLPKITPDNQAMEGGRWVPVVPAAGGTSPAPAIHTYFLQQTALEASAVLVFCTAPRSGSSLLARFLPTQPPPPPSTHARTHPTATHLVRCLCSSAWRSPINDSLTPLEVDGPYEVLDSTTVGEWRTRPAHMWCAAMGCVLTWGGALGEHTHVPCMGPEGMCSARGMEGSISVG